MGEKPDRAVTRLDGALGEPLIWNLPDVARRRAQNGKPFADEDVRRERRVARAGQSDKFRNFFEFWAKDVSPPPRAPRPLPAAELPQPLESLRVVCDVD